MFGIFLFYSPRPSTYRISIHVLASPFHRFYFRIQLQQFFLYSKQDQKKCNTVIHPVQRHHFIGFLNKMFAMFSSFFFCITLCFKYSFFFVQCSLFVHTNPKLLVAYSLYPINQSSIIIIDIRLFMHGIEHYLLNNFLPLPIP